MTKDEARQLAYEKLVKEYDEFIKGVKQCDVDTVISMTYEIELKKKVIHVIALSDYNKQKYDLIIDSAITLEELYTGWISSTEKNVKIYVEHALKYKLEEEILKKEARDYP